MKFLYIVFIFTLTAFNQTYALDKESKRHIQKFIDAIKSNNRERVAKLVNYPLYRESPVPTIKSKKEFHWISKLGTAIM